MYSKFIFGLIVILFLFTTGCLETVVPEGHIQTFEIRPVCITNCVFSNENFTVLALRSNETVLANWHDPVISFTIWADAPAGSTTDDYVTLYFSVENFDTDIFKYNGAYQLLWNETGNMDLWYVKGSKTMPFLQHYNLTLTLDVAIYELSLKSSSDLLIRFRNKENTWEKVYVLNIIIVDIE